MDTRSEFGDEPLLIGASRRALLSRSAVTKRPGREQEFQRN